LSFIFEPPFLLHAWCNCGVVLEQMDYHSMEIVDIKKLFVYYMDVIERENAGETLSRVTRNKYTYPGGSPLPKQ
jgi:hypothetical protein